MLSLEVDQLANTELRKENELANQKIAALEADLHAIESRLNVAEQRDVEAEQRMLGW